MNERQIVETLEQYSRQGLSSDETIQITRIPDHKTVFIEQLADDNSRAIVLTEYKVDGKIYWAAYSQRSQTIFVSLA